MRKRRRKYGRPVPEKIVGTAEAAKLLRVSRQRIFQLLDEDPDFPDPLGILANRRVWFAKDIVAYGKRREQRGRTTES